MDFVPFPRFSSEKLSIWFAQVESVFSINGILTDSEKYDYVVAHLPLDYTTIIEDILLNPPQDDKYGHFKYEFIKRMSLHNLKKEELGSKKPSEYLHRLQKLADQRVPRESILNIWLNNLPMKVREIVSLEPSGHVDILCEMADKVMALITTTPSSQFITEQPGDQFGIILNRLDELAEQVKTLQQIFNNEDEIQQPLSQQRLRAALECIKEEGFKVFKMSPSNSHKAICWYHNIFGDKAVACVAPCQYKFSPTEYYLRH